MKLLFGEQFHLSTVKCVLVVKLARRLGGETHKLQTLLDVEMAQRILTVVRKIRLDIAGPFLLFWS